MVMTFLKSLLRSDTLLSKVNFHLISSQLIKKSNFMCIFCLTISTQLNQLHNFTVYGTCVKCLPYAKILIGS